MALPDSSWTKSSSAGYRQCLAMHFGLPSQRFPKQMFRGSSQHSELESMLLEAFKDANASFGNMIINKYNAGCFMDRHSDGNLIDYPMQILVVFGKFTGGALIVFGSNGTEYNITQPGAYIINGNCEHKVLPIESGTRYSIITYCKNLTPKTDANIIEQLRAKGYPIPSLLSLPPPTSLPPTSPATLPVAQDLPNFAP